jgi:hypothetical protein
MIEPRRPGNNRPLVPNSACTRSTTSARSSTRLFGKMVVRTLPFFGSLMLDARQATLSLFDSAPYVDDPRAEGDVVGL